MVGHDSAAESFVGFLVPTTCRRGTLGAVGAFESDLPAQASAPAVAYTDADGCPTDDPSAAVRGEITEFDSHGRPRRLTRFFLDADELPWLPVSEPAFLLWVLVLLVAAWLIIGLMLGLV